MAEDNKVKDAAKVAQDKMGDLENKLDKQSDKLPKLSDQTKATVTGALPWAAGAFGVLSLLWAKDLWDGIDSINKVGDYLSGFVSTVFPSKTNMWIGLALFVLLAVCVGMAFSRKVLDKTKAGWNFLFYGMVVGVVAGLWYLFALSELGNGRAIWTLVLSLGGLYALFQVRDSYKS